MLKSAVDSDSEWVGALDAAVKVAKTIIAAVVATIGVLVATTKVLKTIIKALNGSCVFL